MPEKRPDVLSEPVRNCYELRCQNGHVWRQWSATFPPLLRCSLCADQMDYRVLPPKKRVLE